MGRAGLKPISRRARARLGSSGLSFGQGEQLIDRDN